VPTSEPTCPHCYPEATSKPECISQTPTAEPTYSLYG
jgi:hypothetical protein